VISWAQTLPDLLTQFGLLAVFACVALESMGLPLPGETILVLATTVAAHSGGPSFWQIFATASVAAILGDNAGYLLGRFGGWPLLRRYGQFVRLDQPKMKVARYLFARHGGTVVFAGRFVAILRTTSAFLAGVNHMPWRRFLACNAAGGVTWAGVWTALASLFGSQLDRLSGPGQLVVAGMAVTGVVGATMVVRRRWRRFHRAAELAYPGVI
jgi:membrane protein DedA with SNARE-associated domain